MDVRSANWMRRDAADASSTKTYGAVRQQKYRDRLKHTNPHGYRQYLEKQRAYNARRRARMKGVADGVLWGPAGNALGARRANRMRPDAAGASPTVRQDWAVRQKRYRDRLKHTNPQGYRRYLEKQRVYNARHRARMKGVADGGLLGSAGNAVGARRASRMRRDAAGESSTVRKDWAVRKKRYRDRLKHTDPQEYRRYLERQRVYGARHRARMKGVADGGDMFENFAASVRARGEGGRTSTDTAAPTRHSTMRFCVMQSVGWAIKIRGGSVAPPTSGVTANLKLVVNTGSDSCTGGDYDDCIVLLSVRWTRRREAGAITQLTGAAIENALGRTRI
ncbi:hypothetical protein BaRGS_00027482, partial [Batillaria attramentaria]